MLTTTLTFAIAAMGNSPVAPIYNPVYPDIPPLPMEVMGEAASPKIVIQRLKAIDNLDANIFTADRADFYAIVLVNDVEFKTRVMAKDDGSPRWEIPLPALVERAHVKIRIFDDDGSLEQSDDHVDISRGANKKDLIFDFYPQTGLISGDVNGWLGDSFYTRGVYDGDKAQMWFSVR